MRYYLIGIGGIGMSALARYFKQTGHEVSGYDRTASPLTKALEQEGIAIHYDDDPTKIPEGVDLAIYTPAIAAETAELQYIQQRGIALKKRSQVLGELTRGKRCTPNGDPVHEITIIPRGMTGGYTSWLPEEDRTFITKGFMTDTIKHCQADLCV